MICFIVEKDLKEYEKKIDEIGKKYTVLNTAFCKAGGYYWIRIDYEKREVVKYSMKNTVKDLVRNAKEYIRMGWVTDQAMQEAWDELYDDIGEDFSDLEIAKIRDRFFNNEFDRLDQYESRNFY